MSINYTVQAEVVDLRTDQPKGSDSFLVDTNFGTGLPTNVLQMQTSHLDLTRCQSIQII